VLGQPDFVSNLGNSGGLSASSMLYPRSVLVIGTKLVVSDSENHRILIWDSIPTTNNHAADVVLGQPSFTVNTTDENTATANNFWWPFGIASDGTNLAIADFRFNRVLLWDNIPTTNNSPASTVIGQSSFSSTNINQGGVSLLSLQAPQGVTIINNKLYISDTHNNRVLVIPIE